MTTAHQSLIDQILSQAKNVAVAAAMLVGSSGESNQNPYDVGSGGGGAFGFTPPNYPSYLESAPPSQQVSAILPSYEEAFQEAEQQGLANAQGEAQGISQPALEEWIALNAERPLNYEQEVQQIEQTGQPTEYGANSSYYVQNWQSQIVPELQGKDVLTSAEIAGGPVYSSGSGTDIFTQAMVKLNDAMNPHNTSSGLLGDLGFILTAPVDRVLSRGLFALGFGIVAIGEFFSLSTGGSLTGRDIPSLVAGFVAGPEIGMTNALSKIGVRGIKSPNTQLSEQRLALSQQREQRMAGAQEANRQLAERRLQESIRRSTAIQQRIEARNTAIERRSQARERQAEKRLQIQSARESRLQTQTPLAQYRAKTARRRVNLERRRQRYLERMSGYMEDEEE